MNSGFFERNNSFRILLASIILLSVGLNIIVFYSGLFSISADESGRTIQAYQWISGTYKGIPTWLPFYTITIGYALKFFPDLFVTPRIIISFFGLLAFISLVWSAHELFKDRYVTLLTALITLFFPTRVVLSSVPLSESMFYFFVFTGIALFTRWLNTKNTKYILFAAVSFAFSSSVRYEGWVLSGVFVLVLILLKRLRSERIKNDLILFTLLICFAFPMYWLIYQSDMTGNPLNFFFDVNKHYEKSQGITLFSIIKNNYLTRFLHHNIIYLCFPGLITLGYLFLRDSKIRKWVSLPLLAFIPLVFISLTGRGVPTHNIWRIPELWNILLLPFTAYFISNINSFNIKYFKNLKRPVVLILLLVILLYYTLQIFRYKDEANFTKSELRVGQYAEEYLIKKNDNNKILIEVPDWSFLHIAVASNNPGAFIKSTEGGVTKIRRNQTITDSSSTGRNNLIDKHINYVMVKTSKLQKVDNHKSYLKKKKEIEGWSVYEFIK